MNSPAQPRTAVSIIIPTFNRARMVMEAVESAIRQQSDRLEVEVLLIDDGSTDDTRSAIARFGESVRYVRQENGGQSSARNRGIGLAKAEYIKFLDSDDLLLDGALGAELLTAQESRADIVVSDWENFDLTSGERSSSSAPVFRSITDDLLAGRAVPTSAALYRRDLITTIQWDPALRKLDDWDFFCRAALEARGIATLHTPSYVMRDHAGPRATDVSMFANAVEHHIILEKLERALDARDELTPSRRKRLAQYYYKELRVMELNDSKVFHRAADHIQELDPSFVPREEECSPAMRLLGRMFGFRLSTQLHGQLKRMVRR